MKPKIVIILGPTAVGKSEVALELAEKLNGEIVNADSQQVYRYMDIGTGKASKSDRERIRHHLIDIVNPDEDFNVALFRRLAKDAIGEIHSKGKNAFLCGGTGLYLQGLVQGLFEGPGQDSTLRAVLKKEIADHGLSAVYRRLLEIDFTVASTIHPNDRQRIIRALEVYQLTGKPLSEWQKQHGFQESFYTPLKIGVNRQRSELYALINQRSEDMVSSGLLDEVRALVDRGYGLDLRPLQSVGYRQMGAVFQGRMTLAEALEEMKQETRHLAKRQLTWFRRDTAIAWFHPDRQAREILEMASGFLDQ
jgi:tRNA dimethylallyltransferase